MDKCFDFLTVKYPWQFSNLTFFLKNKIKYISCGVYEIVPIGVQTKNERCYIAPERVEMID